MPRVTPLARCLLPILACLLAACETRIVNDGWDRWQPEKVRQANMLQPTPEGIAHDRPNATDTTFAVLIMTFEGADHAEQAQSLRSQIAGSTNTGEGLWVADEGWRSHVYYGKYPDREDEELTRAFAQWQDLKQRGVVSFPTFLPLIAHVPDIGSLPIYNLRLIPPPAIYSFKIAEYDANFAGDFRRAAEERARELRDEGFEGYYLHELDNSSVTIGVYPPESVRFARQEDGTIVPSIVDPRVLVLRQQFPSITLNGQKSLARSSLIEIPR